jgi:hypothetical protein
VPALVALVALAASGCGAPAPSGNAAGTVPAAGSSASAGPAVGSTVRAPGGSTAAPATTAPSSTASAGPSATAASEPAAVPKLLDFSSPGVDGGSIDARSFAGKAVAFWFWAPT